MYFGYVFCVYISVSKEVMMLRSGKAQRRREKGRGRNCINTGLTYGILSPKETNVKN